MRLPALAVGDTHAVDVDARNLRVDKRAHLAHTLQFGATYRNGHVSTHAEFHLGDCFFVLLLLCLNKEIGLILIKGHLA